MADELFDGNIASQMTLGDAIVQGTLSPPHYVLAMNSYEKDLERLCRKIRTARNRAVRENAKAYVEKLRSDLANANNLFCVDTLWNEIVETIRSNQKQGKRDQFLQRIYPD